MRISELSIEIARVRFGRVQCTYSLPAFKDSAVESQERQLKKSICGCVPRLTGRGVRCKGKKKKKGRGGERSAPLSGKKKKKTWTGSLVTVGFTYPLTGLSYPQPT